MCIRDSIIGGYGEIYEKIDSSMITKNPYAVKIMNQDTAYILSLIHI